MTLLSLLIGQILVKTEHKFEDYSFSQTTLEQVFIKFAKQQEEADTED